MKILQAIHDFLPRHQAGSELYCYHLSKGLQAQGHDVRIFYSEIDHNLPNYSLREGDYNGLPFYEFINNHSYSTFEQTYENAPAEKAFAQVLDDWQPNIVHFHHLLNLSFGCITLAKERGCAVVFTLHDYWLTCPRGGGQRFRGEGQICHDVDTNLCAECISRYSVPHGIGIRAVKKILRWMEPTDDPTLLTAMQKGKTITPQRHFVQRGVCDINGDVRQSIFAHPPTAISVVLTIPEQSTLAFSYAMDPSTYDKPGNGVLFRIKCDGEQLFEDLLHAKQNSSDQGWHYQTIDIGSYAGAKRQLTFETSPYPDGDIDYCSACWAEPKLVHPDAAPYQPSATRKFQSIGETWLSAFQKPTLKGKVERRTAKAMELFQRVDLFIAPSKFLREKFIEYGMDEERIVYSDYGIADLKYTVEAKAPQKPIRFTYIGTLVEHKGLHALIEAFNKLPPDSAILDVYGSLDEFTGYVSRIQSMVGHPGINLRGRAENEQISHILANADVLVIPSIWFENSPITIHEAFLARVPVITSNFGGMAGLVQDGHNGLLFEVGNSDDLYRCLKRVVENPSLLDSIRPSPDEVKSIADDCEWMEEQYKRLMKQEAEI